MPVTAARKWLLTVLLFLYAGSAIASVSVPCHLSTAEQHSAAPIQIISLIDAPEVDVMGAMVGHHHHAHTMDHSAQEAAATSVDPASQDVPQHDCCDMGNHCLSANCSLPGLEGRLQFASPLRNVSTLPVPNSDIPPDPSYSLYRPPIPG